MKKALIVLALFCVSAAQAITFNWTTPTDSWINSVSGGGLVYSAVDQTTSPADLASLYALVKNSTEYTGYNVVSATSTNDENTLWNGTGAEGSAVSYAELADTATKSDTGTYFVVLFSDDGKYAIAKADAATVKDSAWSDVSGTGDYNWVPPTLEFKGTLVPEPTVLALLALGVAGLALRRKA